MKLPILAVALAATRSWAYPILEAEEGGDDGLEINEHLIDNSYNETTKMFEGAHNLTVDDIVIRYGSNGQSWIGSPIGTTELTAGHSRASHLGVINQATFERLILMSQYSASAYCTRNSAYLTRKNREPIKCSAKNCPLVEEAGAYATLKFNKIGTYHTTGYVGVDEVNKYILVVFRGSGDQENWNGSLNFGRKPYHILPGCVHCKGHTGFLALWDSVRPSVTAEVRRLIKLHPGFRVVGTGHSLGGALATLAMADLRAAGVAPDAEMFSYGAPRVGNIPLSQYITDQGRNYRVTHRNDMVPRLPPMILGYVHISPEFHISRKRSMDIEDVDYFNMASLSAGNRGVYWMGSKSQHRWYFGYITACRRPELKFEEKYDVKFFKDGKPEKWIGTEIDDE